MLNVIKNPSRPGWPALTQRPELKKAELSDRVAQIISEVQLNGDAAMKAFALKFDGCPLLSLQVSEAEIKSASVSPALKKAIRTAISNITKFHRSQAIQEKTVVTMPGVRCWRKSLPIERVGLYIPGGSAPLFSTILMLAIPAKIAGCKEIILCTPPDRSGAIHPAILYTAKTLGIEKIFKAGGAQAIAAMTFGTQTIPAVNKIFGPGNQYVTEAKQQVTRDGVSIDMPAGPSEVLVIGDSGANPEFVAADLLSQAEHGSDSQVILVSNSIKLIDAVNKELNTQLKSLPRSEFAEKSLRNGSAILLKDLNQCIEFSNTYAPEHLILAVRNPEVLAKNVTSAGSVFLGDYSCESAGDYASGTNHTLPTNGYARNYSGVSLDSFVKKVTFQKLSKGGIGLLGPAIEIMAEAEGLMAHKNAVSVRLKCKK